MNHTWISRNFVVLMGLIVVLSLGLVLGGCSDKPAVETETPLGDVTGPDETQEIPETPTPETPEVPVVPDYATLAPEEYGIQDIYFAFDQYELDTESMGLLSANARILREADVAVLVSGHCDERGTVEYNLALGEKRAQAVRDYLISLGVPARNLRVTSYGESKPFARGHDEDAWAMNRRAHFERP